MKAIFTVGCSASGKSTWARDFCKITGSMEINRDNIRIAILMDEGSITDPAYLWTKWNFKREAEVSKRADELIEFCVKNELDIVFSDTNLSAGRLNAQMKRMTDLGYEVEIKYFAVADIDVLIKRDRMRVPSVGESVIRKQWLQWLSLGEEVTGIKKYVANKELPPAIVVDIDGTVAKMVNRGPFDWGKVDQDGVNPHVADTIQCLWRNTMLQVIFLSGRDSVCREKTIEWIKKNVCNINPDDQLFMRKEGDCRKDRIIKDELFWEHVAPNYNVVAAFDDRRQMIQYWTDIGVPLFNVGNYYEDF